MTPNFSSERGQAVVLLVLAMIALMGFTALAVDGSMLYSDRRYAQMTSDSAAMAGASVAAQELDKNGATYTNWDCQSSAVTKAAKKASQAAVNSAQANGVTIDLDIADRNGVSTQCGVDMSKGYRDPYLDILTQVTLQTQTGFAHFVNSSLASNTVEAVARVRPRSPLAFGYAIVALNPADCQGMNTGAEFHGTQNIYVSKGGIFTNGCLRGVGNQSTIVTDASIHYRSDYRNEGGSSFNPAPQKITFKISPADYAIPEPNCDHPNAHHIDGKDLRGNLAPGLYCVDGQATINAHDTLIGFGVTIVMLNDRLQINGKATVQLTAPASSPDPSPAIPGVVIYAPPDTNYKAINQNGIHLNGNSDSFFSGVVLAPALDVFVNGTSRNDAYLTQIIGWNVQVGGTADTWVLFNQSVLHQKLPAVELHR